MMRTTATRQGDKWIINGRKWFITGAGVARHFILIARTSHDARKALTAFLFDAGQPGWPIERRIPIMGPEEHCRHWELVIHGLEIPHGNPLMEVGGCQNQSPVRMGSGAAAQLLRRVGLA